MKLFQSHAFLIFLGLVGTLTVYAVIDLAGRPIDDRVIGTIGVGLAGGLLGFANRT